MYSAANYIERMKLMTLEELQAESEHCLEKLDGAIKLQHETCIKYYGEALKHLLLFRIVEERPDIPKRSQATFNQFRNHDS